jgi:hypothetical protein
MNLLAMRLCKLLFTILHSQKGTRTPSCASCAFYQPSTSDGEFESISGQCTKFQIHDYAESFRLNESRCGAEGRFFQEERNLPLKVIQHKIVTTMPYGIGILIVLFLRTLAPF